MLCWTNAISPSCEGKIGNKTQLGGMTDRLFGNSEWGFNRGGYVEATVTVALNNNWFHAGVGKFLLGGKKFSLISETHGVLRLLDPG